MKAIDIISEEVAIAPNESGDEFKSFAEYRGRATRVLEAPVFQLGTKLPASGSKLAQPRKRIYIVEHQPAFCEALKQILNGAEDLTVCGTARAVAQALPVIARTMPDLVLVEVGLLGKAGMELIRAVRLVDASVKLLILSQHKEALHAARALRSGGDGYTLKHADPDEIVSAIHDVLDGHIYVSEEVMDPNQGEGRRRSFLRENLAPRAFNNSRI
jgi:DNA-binding NarL/FixJ family response regulator